MRDLIPVGDSPGTTMDDRTLLLFPNNASIESCSRERIKARIGTRAAHSDYSRPCVWTDLLWIIWIMLTDLKWLCSEIFVWKYSLACNYLLSLRTNRNSYCVYYGSMRVSGPGPGFGQRIREFRRRIFLAFAQQLWVVTCHYARYQPGLVEPAEIQLRCLCFCCW